MSEQPKLSIIIVSYNVKELLTNCLDSINNNQEDLDFEIIVVDNTSSDGSQEMLANRDDIELILSNKNLGFAKGNNLGLQHSKGEYVLFLNPDTKIQPGALATMVSYLDNNQRYEALGPKLLNPDLTMQLSVRKFPTLGSQLMIMSKLHNLLTFLPAVKNYYQLKFNYNELQEVDQVMGAALLVRKWVIDELNGFDPKFKRIFEEVDLCRRIKTTGYQLVYFPAAQIIHYKGASFHGSKFEPSLDRQKNFNRDMLYYFRKHKPLWNTLILLLFLPASWLLTWLTELITQIIPATKKLKKKDL